MTITKIIILPQKNTYTYTQIYNIYIPFFSSSKSNRRTAFTEILNKFVSKPQLESIEAIRKVLVLRWIRYAQERINCN